MKRSGAPVPAVFTRLFAAQRESVRSQLARIVPASEVDDVLQEVFVKAARGLAQFRGEADLKTWLHRIAQRTAVDYLRSRLHHERQRTVALAGDENDPVCTAGGTCRNAGTAAEAPERLIQAEMHRCIRDFITRLSPEHAEVLSLKDLEDLTNAEISARLGISVDATKIRLHRARIAMRSLLDGDCEMYRTAENTLACDRKVKCPVARMPATRSRP